MKKIALFLAIVLVVGVPLTAQAATPRLVSIIPAITFSGTTANCSVRIAGNSNTDSIQATIRLWHGDSCLETWNVSGTGYLIWKDTAAVASGNYYVLTVDAVIAGVVLDQVYASGTCS